MAKKGTRISALYSDGRGTSSEFKRNSELKAINCYKYTGSFFFLVLAAKHEKSPIWGLDWDKWIENEEWKCYAERDVETTF